MSVSYLIEKFRAIVDGLVTREGPLQVALHVVYTSDFVHGFHKSEEFNLYTPEEHRDDPDHKEPSRWVLKKSRRLAG